MIPSSPPQVLITSSSQKVFVQSSCALGAGSTPAANLRLSVCYRLQGSSTVEAAGLGVWGLTSPANQRSVWSLSATFTGLTPDATTPYEFGLCGYTNPSGAANWNNNEFCFTSVVVSN